VTADLKTLLKTARTIAEIKAAVALANEAIVKARRDDDLRSLRYFFELKMRFERRAGEILGKCSDYSGLGESTVKRWLALAELSETEFNVHINLAVAKQTTAPHSACRIKMVISEFKLDEWGNPYRLLSAVDR
jgi:hypothetical protein